MEQNIHPSNPESLRRQAPICRQALGSLHCRLERREKLVIEQIIRFSFDLGFEQAEIGSNDHLAILTDLHKTDVSKALAALERTQIIQAYRAVPLHGLRRPMLYRLLPKELVRLSQPPARSAGRSRAVAMVSEWTLAANQCYPLQPELLPPDPELLDDALAEISRASALAGECQNEMPKPGGESPRAGEVSFSEGPQMPGPARRESYPEKIARLARESMASAAWKEAEPGLVGKSPTRTEPGLVGDFPTSSRTGASDASDVNKDGDINIPSGKHPDGEGPVGKSPTRILAAAFETEVTPWRPPTTAEELFADVRQCIGSSMGTYSSWWWDRCRDSAEIVYETLCYWKLSRLHPRCKPWGGGRWRDQFDREKKRLLQAKEKSSAN